MGHEFAAGEVVAGRFQLEQIVGEGGFGVVWRAKDQANGQAVALKFLREEALNRPVVLSHFRREASILSALDHPGIARLIAYEPEPSPFIVLEFVVGTTLDQYLFERAARRSMLSTLEIVQTLTGISSLLDYAHSKGVIHRDIKPSNVILRSPGDGPPLKLLDFGIARLLEADPHDRTTAGRVMGTCLYISPEQVMGHPAGVQSDVFALASLAFEMFTLRSCWGRTREGAPAPLERAMDPAANPVPAITGRIIRGEHARVTEWRTDVSPAVDAVFARGLAFSAEDRPLSASDFVGQLSRALTGGEDALETLDDDETAPNCFMTEPIHAVADTMIQRPEIVTRNARVAPEIAAVDPGGATKPDASVLPAAPARAPYPLWPIVLTVVVSSLLTLLIAALVFR